MTKTVFISGVSSELGTFRARIASELRKRGVEVKEQEDFPQGPGTLLQKLKNYINRCDAVICLIGDAYGAKPPDAITPDSKRRSYTQWEFQFAHDRHKKTGMPVFVYIKKENSDVGAPFTQSEEEANLQRQFREEVRNTGLDYGPIESKKELAIQVLHHDWSPSASRPPWHRWVLGVLLLILIGGSAFWAYTNSFTKAPERKPQIPTGKKVSDVKEKEITALVKRYLSIPQQIINSPHPKRESVNSLKPPDNAGFAKEWKKQVWDLREWKPLKISNGGEDGSKVTLHSSAYIRKMQSQGTYIGSFKTSGEELFVRPNTNLSYDVWAAKYHNSIVGDVRMLERQVHYGVSEIPIGTAFPLEAVATYWNSMQTKNDLWVGVQVMEKDKINNVAMLILFPQDRPWQTYWATAAHNNSDQLRDPIQIDPNHYDTKDYYFLIDEENKGWIYWEILSPTPGFVYQLRWEWEGIE